MKLAIINSTKGSYWNSCKTIQENLMRSIQMLGPEYEIELFDFPENQDFSGLATEVLKSNVDEIFYIAHYPHPLEFIKSLKDISKSSPRVSLLIYGSFTSWLVQWHQTFTILKDSNVRLICGSQSQSNLLNKFVDASIEVLPFPVDTKIFLPPKTPVNNKVNLIYTGRISYEKNIHYLIEYLFNAQDCGVLANGFELKLIGHFDNVYHPLFNDGGLFGSYYFYLFDEIAKKVGKERFFDQIKFLSFCSHNELAIHLSNSDIFVSLSTFTFEDFGMSAAEALEMGVLCLLSAWGGHHGLKSIYPERVNLVKCELKDQYATPLYASFEQELRSLLSYNRTIESGRLSIEMTSKKMATFLNRSEFKKLKVKDLFHNFVSNSGINPFRDKEVFKEVYETYLIG